MCVKELESQMAAKEDTFMQAPMATMTPQQLESVNAVFANPGFDGPIADELRKVMIQEIARLEWVWLVIMLVN